MTINFIKKKKICLLISITVCIISLVIIFNKKFNIGLEFYGGTEIEIKITNNLKIEEIKNKLSNIKNIKINYYGSNTNIQIKTKNTDNKINDIKNILNNFYSKDIQIINSTYTGAEINKETINKSIYAIVLAIIIMITYLIIRFNIIFSISAILTLFHDILIILGIISLADIEINLIMLSAIFTIFGYSVNDTIIIFDRIREYLKNNKQNNNLNEIINISINNTLSRTINTSFSTILVTSILIIFSGEYLFWFSVILTLGIIIGTYSSIYISVIPLTFLKRI